MSRAETLSRAHDRADADDIALGTAPRASAARRRWAVNVIRRRGAETFRALGMETDARRWEHLTMAHLRDRKAPSTRTVRSLALRVQAMDGARIIVQQARSSQ